ncbi:helix-turn-helix transcriptional regulator [Streptomyces sp. TRM 70351]|uniref:helix-turn-helix domain-containing protein n=1 Tax=Streptomyces sp. TRM 70351 TaxID=3116552 RepID=UPI002E7C0D1E|nr:helix-turn-helix transcriptional regulator [Streptomyces sp. TRM 70351]MEE1926871.1 helix-turn-helix transcriptional regulator [Streptomyces sp. TRM 70351]
MREIDRILRELLWLLEAAVDAAPAPLGSARPPGAGSAAPPPPGGAEWRRDLTPREHEILALLLTGMSNRAIARRLGITERTVKNTLHPVYRKLGVAGRAEAIVRFLRGTSPPGDAAGGPPGRRASGPPGPHEPPGGAH